jgi:hypothetical protein
MPTTRNERPAAIGIVSPVRQFVTALSIEGGSAGVPSAGSSLTVKVIQSWDRTAAPSITIGQRQFVHSYSGDGSMR